MLPCSRNGSRLVDSAAIAALVGTAVGFAIFLTFAPLPTSTEWNRLIGAQRIALIEHSPKPAPPGETGHRSPHAFPDSADPGRPAHADGLT